MESSVFPYYFVANNVTAAMCPISLAYYSITEAHKASGVIVFMTLLLQKFVGILKN